MKKRFAQTTTALAALALCLSGTMAFAQQASAPAATSRPAQPSHDGRSPQGGDRDQGRDHRGGMDGPHYNIMPEGMGTPNRWWHIPGLVQAVGLTNDQQTKMDDILHRRLQVLIPQIHDLYKQRDTLQSMLDANPPDAAKLKPLLEHIAQSRAALEVAQDQMLLEIRAVITPDQWNKLQAENRRWRAMHADAEKHEEKRDDHRNFPGRPGGTPPKSN